MRVCRCKFCWSFTLCVVHYCSSLYHLLLPFKTRSVEQWIQFHCPAASMELCI